MQTQTPPPPTIAVGEREAATALGLSVHTLRKDRQKARLIPFYKIGRSVRYDMARVREALATREFGNPVPARKRAPPPTTMVDIRALVGVCAVSREQAESNGRRGVHPMRPRPAQPGLVHLDAKALWKAIDAGTFPAPQQGAKGLEWPLEAVQRWKSNNQ